MEKNIMDTKTKNTVRMATICIVLGILFCYSVQQAPAPILLEVRDHYQIMNNDMLLNMAVSSVYLTIIIGCLTGAKVEAKVGTYKLFSISMVLAVVGSFLTLAAVNYPVLLIARLIYGLGMGFSVQFIGSAIMKYYEPLAREKMNTLNGMFPFLGTVITFFLASPLSKLLGGFKSSIAVWGLPILLALLLWILTVKEKNLPDMTAGEAEEALPKNVYGSLLKRKPILLLCITFVCDFACYAYIAVIVSTLFFEATDMSLSTANLVAAVAFPAVGIAGSGLGGILLNKTGLRKPSLLLGQILKFIGVSVCTLGASNPVLLVGGICLFGLGNGLWMPALYCVPMDLEGMTPALSGASFSLMYAFGMVAGFISPLLGGKLTNVFMEMSGIADATASHVYGLKWSLFIFGLLNLISTVCMAIYKETGKKR